MKNQPDYEKIKQEYKPNKIFSGTKGIFAVAIICFFGFWVLLFVGLMFENPYRFSLPYNAIDFQKIAYIDNQFVMYGIDYNAKYHNQLAIFTSQDGKKWDKGVIAKVKLKSESEERSYYKISNAGTLAYFNHQCFLVGAVSKVLVSPNCHNWSYINTRQIDGRATPFWNARDSTVYKGKLYVTTRVGLFASTDGVTWYQESMPIFNGTDKQQLSGFYSIASGNNKVLTETGIFQDKKHISLIYTKNLVTNKWNCEVYPQSVGHITRGKDRFVAMGESSALVLIDSKDKWESIPLQQRTYDMSFGLNNKFIGTNPIHISSDGFNWQTIKFTEDKLGYSLYIACNSTLCISVGDNYQIIGSTDGVNWEHFEFNLKNPKPHWWRRFF